LPLPQTFANVSDMLLAIRRMMTEALPLIREREVLQSHGAFLRKDVVGLHPSCVMLKKCLCRIGVVYDVQDRVFQFVLGVSPTPDALCIWMT